jgi:hypothetical protein
MPTITTPPVSGGRRVAVAVTGGAIALLALIAVAAVATPAGDRSVAAGAAPTTPSVSAAPTTTERVPTPTSTSTVLAALDADQEFTTWFGSLSPDRQLAFRLLTGTDDERAAFIRLLTPAPAPLPVTPPPPAPVVAPAKPRAPSCATWATQEEANAWFAANAAAHDVSVIDSNRDGVPCTTHFAPPPPPAPPAAPAVEPTAATGAPTGPANAFLACVMRRESGGNYQAVNRSSGAGGAYQFLQSTWNNTVRHAGRPDLVGLHPSQASPADQDAMALHLYQWQGRSPWAGPGC